MEGVRKKSYRNMRMEFRLRALKLFFNYIQTNEQGMINSCYGFLYNAFKTHQIKHGGMILVPPQTVINWALQTVRRQKWLEEIKEGIKYLDLISDDQSISYGSFDIRDTPFHFLFVENKTFIGCARRFIVMSPGPELSLRCED